MAININPFKGLIETRTYPHARAYRTTLKQKLSDTFFIFFGYYNATDKQNNHVGMFDYLLLGIIPLLDRAREYFTQRNGENSIGARMIGGLLAALQILSLLPRIAFAVVFFTISLIPVWLIHAGMSHHGNQLKAIIHHTNPDLDAAENDEDAPLLTNTISAELSQNNTHLEDLCHIETTQPADQPHLLELRFFAPAANPNTSTPKEVLRLRANPITQSRFFQALNELNIGGIQSHIETKEQRKHLMT